MIQNYCPLCNSENFETYFNLQDKSVSLEYFELVKCQDCAFIWTKNAPDEHNIAQYYKSDIYLPHTFSTQVRKYASTQVPIFPTLW